MGAAFPPDNEARTPQDPLFFFFLLPETPFESNLFADEAALTSTPIFFFCSPVKVVMLGLDAAGKTTILYKLHIGEVLSTVPTIGKPAKDPRRPFLPPR